MGEKGQVFLTVVFQLINEEGKWEIKITIRQISIPLINYCRKDSLMDAHISG